MKWTFNLLRKRNHSKKVEPVGGTSLLCYLEFKRWVKMWNILLTDVLILGYNKFFCTKLIIYSFSVFIVIALLWEILISDLFFFLPFFLFPRKLFNLLKQELELLYKSSRKKFQKQCFFYASRRWNKETFYRFLQP